MFKTQFDHGSRVSTCPGSPFLDDYSPIVDKKTGRTNLQKVGKRNIYELIQMDKDTVDINLIMKRFQAGDEKALDVIKGFYADCTNFPENYAQLLQGKIDCDNLFSKLPTDVRSQFENNPDVFWTEFGSEHWRRVLGIQDVDVPFVDNLSDNISDNDVVVDDEVKEVE